MEDLRGVSALDELKARLRLELGSLLGLNGTLQDDTELFSSGVIDSLGVMELVSLVERAIGRSIPPAAITLENFDSIERIARFAAALPGPGGNA